MNSSSVLLLKESVQMDKYVLVARNDHVLPS